MDLVPVIDLKNGQAVRGVAGERKRYQPINSRWLSGSHPLQTLAALRENFSPAVMYVADLDGIEEDQPQLELLREMAQELPLVIDAGVRTAARAAEILELGALRVIVPLESLTHLKDISEIAQAVGPDRVTFSLDLRDGRPIGAAAHNRHPADIIHQVEQLGIWHVIILDLAHVGLGRGVPTSALCQSVKRRHPELAVWTGGGVRNIADLHSLAVRLVDGVMVASALHDGRITPDDWHSFQGLDDARIQQATDA